MEYNTTRMRLLLTTAALLTGVSVASAQGLHEGGGPASMGGGGERGMSASGSAGHAADRMSPGAAGARRGEASESMGRPQRMGRAQGGEAQGERQIGGRRGEARQGQTMGEAQRGQHQTIGEAQRGQQEHRTEREKQMPSATQTRAGEQSHRGAETAKEAGASRHGRTTTGAATQAQKANKLPEETQQNRAGASSRSKGTTGLATSKPTQSPQTQQQDRAGAARQGHATTGQATQKLNQPAQTQQPNPNATARSGAPNVQQNTTGAATGAQPGMAQAQTQGQAERSLSGRTTVTPQQQSAIQQSVLSARNVPRVNARDINFAVDVGAVVPPDYGFASFADYPVLVDDFPAYRDDSFFVEDDDIIVVDGSRRIVDVLPAGPRTHFAGRGVRGGGYAAINNLNPDEIREVQQVLIQRGFLHGEVDGVLGPETRDALIAFQRQEGFEATGTIDSRTVSGLGLSNRIGSVGASQSTVGQGQGRAGQQQSVQQPTTGQPTPRTGQATTGQTAGQAPNSQTTGQAPTSRATGQAPNSRTTGQAPNSQTTGQAGQGAGAQGTRTTNPGAAQQTTTGQAAPSHSDQNNMQAPAPSSGQNPNRR